MPKITRLMVNVNIVNAKALIVSVRIVATKDIFVAVNISCTMALVQAREITLSRPYTEPSTYVVNVKWKVI